MSGLMSVAEREAFLAAPRVAVLSIGRAARAPLSVPIWYAYAPGGDVGLWMEADTPKARALAAAGCCSLVVQDATPPYRYVSVSGPVVAMAPIAFEEELLPLIHRYLDADAAARYIASFGGAAGVTDNLFVRMRPRHWRAEVIGTA